MARLCVPAAQVVFVVIAVVLWLAYNRILLPMADRLEQVLHASLSDGAMMCAPAFLLAPASGPCRGRSVCGVC